MVDAQHYAQLSATFSMDNPFKFTPTYIMAILEKLNRLFVINLKWQHQHTIDSFFKSTVNFVWKNLHIYKDI